MASSKKKKKISKARRETTEVVPKYANYISRAQKTMFKGGMSKIAVLALDQMCVYLVDRLSVEAARASNYARSSTLNLRAASTATQLALHGQLAQEAETFASRAVVRYVEAKKQQQQQQQQRRAAAA